MVEKNLENLKTQSSSTYIQKLKTKKLNQNSNKFTISNEKNGWGGGERGRRIIPHVNISSSLVPAVRLSVISPSQFSAHFSMASSQVTSLPSRRTLPYVHDVSSIKYEINEPAGGVSHAVTRHRIAQIASIIIFSYGGGGANKTIPHIRTVDKRCFRAHAFRFIVRQQYNIVFASIIYCTCRTYYYSIVARDNTIIYYTLHRIYNIAYTYYL